MPPCPAPKLAAAMAKAAGSGRKEASVFAAGPALKAPCVSAMAGGAGVALPPEEEGAERSESKRSFALKDDKLTATFAGADSRPSPSCFDFEDCSALAGLCLPPIGDSMLAEACNKPLFCCRGEPPVPLSAVIRRRGDAEDL
mmetsp:Transcript_91176/g.162348  ORF Transcript_91176/g.162348 Transcript_91176/m.162348 type:complete len:142 (+) Transcript_91176:119-544(+)